MVLALLTKLASFSLRRPKLIGFAVLGIAIGAFGIHYKLLTSERDKLRVAEAGYQRAVTQFVLREESLQEDIRTERLAAAAAVAERNEARRSVDELRAGRETDPESFEWAADSIPPGELNRLCIALPEMDGC